MEQALRIPPVSVYAETTPNPLSLRFVATRVLLPEGRMMEFRTAEEAEGLSPLAAHVFNLPFVQGVFISNNFITVTRNEVVTWDLVQLELREYIQEFLRQDGRVVNAEAPTQVVQEAAVRAASHTPASTPEEVRIVEVLDEYVRPAVEADGGHIAFHTFREGVVTVRLQGSCSGCPSSMVTLKGGIENLLKQMVPGVREVVAEEL
ncbi:MAG: NifU family protein [Flavobacteriales bacterium]|nr:NifU family protein [Flavobacteriales bacterium]